MECFLEKMYFLLVSDQEEGYDVGFADMLFWLYGTTLSLQHHFDFG